MVVQRTQMNLKAIQEKKIYPIFATQKHFWNGAAFNDAQASHNN